MSKINIDRTYKFYADGGHGWLAVPIDIVRSMGIKVTGYSYRNGNTLYLEEDHDATTFHYAFKKLTGREHEIEYIRHRGESPIRHYVGNIPKDLLEQPERKTT